MSQTVAFVFGNPPAMFDDRPIRAAGADVLYRHCPTSGATEEQLIQACQGADVVISGSTQPVTRRVMEQLENCKLIEMMGVGYDGADVVAATELGICISNNPFYSLDSVSDHAMALVLSCARKIPHLNNEVKARHWFNLTGDLHVTVVPPMSGLRNKTLGLVGFGNIAKTMVPKAHGFGMRVLAYDPYVAGGLAKAFGVELVDLNTLASQSDFVSVHAILTPANRHLFGAEQFGRMKRTAYFINTSRGGLVDEQALIAALQNGQIAGAGLDVTEREPIEHESPLMDMDNVILTPHSGYYTEEAQVDQWGWLVEEAVRMLRGQWPIALVNPAVKEKFAARWTKVRS